MLEWANREKYLPYLQKLTRKLPPPYSKQRSGNLQTLPNPTAYPKQETKKSKGLFHCPRLSLLSPIKFDRNVTSDTRSLFKSDI